jgi:hypothetical protein
MTNIIAAPSRWPSRLGIVGIAAAAIAALGAYGSGWGLWHFTIGFLMIGVALLLAFIAIIGGAITILRHGRTWLLSAGIVAALGLLTIVGNTIYRGSQFPAIHDISTNTAFPPQFEHITPRADLYAGLEGGREEWRRLHRAAYGDIGAHHSAVPAATLMPQIEQLVRNRGWDVVYADSQRIEATATVSPFRFRDDIVITATDTGSRTMIDIRSVSRVGRSDLGVNARRVRALMRDIVALEASP